MHAFLRIGELTVRARGLYAEHTLAARNASMHNRTPPKPTSINKWLTPIAECIDGGLHWHPEWVKLSYTYKVNLSSWERTKGAMRDNPPTAQTQENTATGGGHKEVTFIRGGVQLGEGGGSPTNEQVE